MTSKFFRMMLVGVGVIVTISGIVNLASAIALLEPSDEAALGVNRTTIDITCTVAILCGIGLIYLGLKKKKTKK